MRIATLIAALLLSLPAAAQAPPAERQPPPTVTLTLAELDALIQQAADTPARFSYPSLQLLLSKRQAAMAPAPATPEPKAP